MKAQRQPNQMEQKAMRIITVGLMVILAMVAYHQWSGGSAEVAQPLPVLKQNTVYLNGTHQGGPLLRDADKSMIAEFDAGDGGFFEPLITVINRQRTRHAADLDQPIIARLHSEKHLTVFDPETGQTYNLASYGDQNVDRLITYLIAEN